MAGGPGGVREQAAGVKGWRGRGGVGGKFWLPSRKAVVVRGGKDVSGSKRRNESRRVTRLREEERCLEGGAGGVRERAAGVEGW